ncbi:unnamed protein product [Diamesa hyperborea]
MKRVFKRLGYEQVDGLKDDWDVLWTVGSPFEGTNLSTTVLKPHQRINHFIGMPLLTTKKNLVTQTKSKYIPQAFQFPSQIDDFKEFIKNNPNKKFVVKNYDNRGVKIVKEEEIDYNSTTKFVQEFIEDPLLIDDRAFDFGVYVLITSISPLRIYRFKSEVLVRFCPTPYYPFDPNNVDKYVVQESHKTVWEMPSLKNISQKAGFSYKTSVESHLASRGINVNKLWEQIDDAIVTLIQEKELQFTRLSEKLNHRNMFELLRFDFIFTAALRVYLMEANLSPNLTPTEDRFEKWTSSYEQVISNTLNLIGAGSYLEFKETSKEAVSMISSRANVAVKPLTCSNNPCRDHCSSFACDLCVHCMHEDKLFNVHRAYREHIRRGEMKRLFPTTKHFSNEYLQTLTPPNFFMGRWYREKCMQDDSWC